MSHNFYKGKLTDNENEVFLRSMLTENINNEEPLISEVLSNDIDDSQATRKRIMTAFKECRGFAARKAIFVSFSLLLLSCSGLVFRLYVTDVFHKSGSVFSDKDSSFIISIITIIGNIVFLNIVERVNRQVILNIF